MNSITKKIFLIDLMYICSGHHELIMRSYGCIMFRKTITIFLLTPAYVFCQDVFLTSCPNSNLSQGNFQYWTGCYGTVSDPCQTQGFDTLSTYPAHAIVSNVTATDPHTCNNLLKVLPGETHSARVGRDTYTTSGASGSVLKYTIQVSSQPWYFKYHYAIVLMDGGHASFQQPNFMIEVKDSLGNIVDPVHGYHYYYAQSGLPGWQTCTTGGTYRWLGWTTDSVDLSAYAGHTVTVIFTARCCVFGNHPGYAYIDAYCISGITREWTGSENSDWSNPANWDPAGIPTWLDTVVIPSFAPVMPVVNVNGMTCNTLHIGDEATITIPPGITLTVKGDVVMEMP